MLSGGPEEGVIPLECGEASGGALTVEALEELALRVVPLLCVRARRKEKKEMRRRGEIWNFSSR